MTAMQRELLVNEWQDFYSNEDGERLQVHVKGVFILAPDGNVKIDRQPYRCF